MKRLTLNELNVVKDWVCGDMMAPDPDPEILHERFGFETEEDAGELMTRLVKECRIDRCEECQQWELVYALDDWLCEECRQSNADD